MRSWPAGAGTLAPNVRCRSCLGGHPSPSVASDGPGEVRALWRSSPDLRLQPLSVGAWSHGQRQGGGINDATSEGPFPLDAGSAGSPGNSEGHRCQEAGQQETERLDALRDSFCKQGPAVSRRFRGFPKSVSRWHQTASAGPAARAVAGDVTLVLLLSELFFRV